MRYFISISILILQAAASGQNCKAVLQVITDNDLAFVIINDSLNVAGRNATFELSPGTYYMVVGENSDRWNAETFYDTVNITSCDSITKTYSFFEGTYLETEPHDAYVYHSDTLIGHTPLRLSSRLNTVILTKPGYEDEVVSLSSNNDEMTVRLKFIPVEENGSFFKSPLFLYLSAGLVVLGGVTAYYKLEADDKYSEYQVTGDPKLLDRTRRYDTISGISFGALQINFGLLLYFFLTD